jgi:hypothetical protein
MSVAFDDGAASALISAAGAAASVLRDQGAPRRTVVENAAAEFRGAYATLFTNASGVEAADRGGLAGVLDNLAHQVRDAKAKAAEERQRQETLAAWRVREDERRRERALDPTGSGWVADGSAASDPKPSTVRIAPPVVSATFIARERTRVAGKSTSAGKTSADPAQLRAFVTQSRGSNNALEQELSRVTTAWHGFETSCSWVPRGSITFLNGFRILLAENRTDVLWIDNVAAAFENAGGGSLSNVGLSVVSDVAVSDSGTLLDLILGDALSPEEVAAAWAMLTATPGFDEARTLRVYAEQLGSLDGIPALARVEANKNRVPGLLAVARAELKDIENVWPVDAGRVEMLRNEIAYLQQVTRDKDPVQLYLYDRDNSRIVEMIGTPGLDTRDVLTYVPGTFTSMNDFYKGGVQQIAREMATNAPGTVAFVYKDGIFPGEDRKAGGQDFSKIATESNNLDIIAALGQQLASFQTGIRADPLLGGAEQNAFGHSAGLSIIAASEMSKTHYTEVVSLSGSGMPPGWKASPSTRYTDMSYFDALQLAQQSGPIVLGGNNPRSNPAFEHGDYYEPPGENLPQSPYPSTYPAIYVPITQLIDNHNLVATTLDDNRAVADDLLAVVKR